MLTAAADRPSWSQEYGGRWPIELGALALLLTIASIVAPLGDPDMPLHLALGEWIVRFGGVPRTEPFAWTRNGDPFFAYSWLPELAFYSAYRAGGVTGLRILQGMTVLSTLVAMLMLARLARWSVWTGVLLAGVQALLAMVLVPYLRPQAVLLIVVPLAWACALRMLSTTRPAPWAAATFALSAVAANSHLLFVLTGAPWLLLALRWPGARRAAWLVGATVAGWLVTPYALDWPSVVALNFNDNALFDYPTPIAELTPGVQAAVSGSGALLAIAVLLAALPWLAARLTNRERFVWGVAWLAGLLAFALAARAILIWWLLLLPLVALLIEPLARVPRNRTTIVGQRIALGALVLLLASARARVAGAEWAQDTTSERWLPTRAARWVDPLSTWLECRVDTSSGGRVLTSFSFGTYLTWRAPAFSYSIDGRNIFPDSVARAESYVLASSGPLVLGPWRSADLAIVPFRYTVSAMLDSAAGWTRAAMVVDPASASDSAGLWVRSSWWGEVSDSGLAASADRLRPGRSGVQEACG